jgi:hypothetical protein
MEIKWNDAQTEEKGKPVICNNIADLEDAMLRSKSGQIRKKEALYVVLYMNSKKKGVYLYVT